MMRQLQAGARIAAGLGLIAVTLTGEIGPVHLALGWIPWLASFFWDRQPRWGERVQRYELFAVAVLVSTFVLDFFLRGAPFFVALTHFLILFQSVKLAGPKSRKDCLQLFLFGFFLMLAACTLSIDAWHAFLFLALIPTASAVLFASQVLKEEETAGETCPAAVQRRLRTASAWICLAAIPANLALATVVFMLFPRLNFQARLSGLHTQRSGYTDQVNLAQTGQLSNDDAVVLWLKPGGSRERWNGYLRGSTMDHFDGLRWTARSRGNPRSLLPASGGVFETRPGHAAGALLHQTVTLLNTSEQTLFAAPFPVEIRAPLWSLQQEADGRLYWTGSWSKPFSYEAKSDPAAAGAKGGPEADSPDLQTAYLQVPAGNWERVRDLAESLGEPRPSGGRDARTLAEAIAAHLQRHYQYSLDQGASVAANPVEAFLFERKSGPCGHFASAMAILLRLRGIPSRIVAGYYQGEWNPMAGQYAIRQRDAHAWVEAYLPEAGWVSFDPSPRQASAVSSHRWLLALRQYWQYIGLRWNRVVIEYDLHAQLRLVEDIQRRSGRMNETIAGWFDRRRRRPRSAPADASSEPSGRLSWKWGLGLILAGLPLVFWAAREAGRRRPGDPAIVFYERFLHRMAREGHPKLPQETGWEYSKRLGREFPKVSPEAEVATRRYYAERFAAIPRPGPPGVSCPGAPG